MSSKSHLVQTNRSMIVLDPAGMPVNLNGTAREDSPEASFPCLIYDGKDILPTALGYKSFFGIKTLFNIGAEASSTLAAQKVQAIILYQSVKYFNIMIALAEDGVYLTRISGTSIAPVWTKVLTPTTPEVEGIRRQWTHCVIKNSLYIYQQGSPKFYALVDLAIYAETTVPTPIEGATISQEYQDEPAGFGILGYVPNFINITAQIGLFKAGNRLGFWDSEGAVAWSSATQYYDFKPSTTTFAGVTTFVDVVGTITQIKQHGNGFIIYSTKSVVLCTALSGTPEKWSGRAIFSEVGVLFDIQVAVGQPDTTHYAITSGGLCVITQGVPEFVEPEVMDYVKKTNQLYALSFIDSRYLFIHCASTINIAVPDVDVVLADSEGNEFRFPKPIYPNPEDFVDVLGTMVNSENPSTQAGFTDAQVPEATPVAKVPEDKALLPCWTGEGLNTNLDATVLTKPKTLQTVYVPSGLEPSTSWEIDTEYFRPLFTNYYYDAENLFIDKAGDEYTQELVTTFEDFGVALTVAIEGRDKFAPVDITRIEDDRERAYFGAANGTVVSDVPVPGLSWTWLKVPTDSVEAVMNDCSIVVEAGLANVEFNVIAEVTETATAGYTVGALEFSFTAPGGSPSIRAVPILVINTSGSSIRYFVPLEEEITTLLQSQSVPSSSNPLEGYPWARRFSLRDITLVESPYYSIEWNSGVGERSPSFYNRSTLAKALLGQTPLYSKEFDDQFTCRITCEGTYDFTTEAAMASADLFCIGIGNYKFVPSPSGSGQLRTSSHGAGLWTTDTTYSLANLDAAQLEVLEPFARKIQLNGITLRTELNIVPVTPATIFEAEVTGFGYIPNGGFSFRKTHSRSIFKPCDPVTRTSFTIYPEDVDKLKGFSTNGSLPVGIPTKPPYDWEYPDSIQLPPNYIVLQNGTASPYYQTYKEALVLDTQLTKWGRFSSDHKYVYSLYPINRTDQTIIPFPNEGMLAGALTTAGQCCAFTAYNPNSRITFGKIGDYRLGYTRFTKFTAQFLGLPTATVVAEVSLSGEQVDKELSQAFTVDSNSYVHLPFTATGKWANIRLEGTFDLVQLTAESSAGSRR